MSYEDRLAIHDLSARYASAADRRDFEKLRDIFTSDATLTAFLGDPADVEPLFKAVGVDDIMQAFGALHRYENTFHFLGQQRVDSLSANNANSETYCVARHWHTKHEKLQCVIWYIRYRDELVKQNGVWRFGARMIVVDRSEGEDV